ncbi:MAG: hypothetical protein F6K47_07640 [Symploca sp. SIO2E6]|nr:hypothetical protein [Symploca sp. SIO2E6]
MTCECRAQAYSKYIVDDINFTVDEELTPLQNQLFEQWMQEKLQQMNIKMEVL